MSLKEFAKELNGNGVEGELIKTMFYSLMGSFALLTILYYIRLRYVADFFPKYSFFILLSVLSFAIIMPAIRQVRAYREFQCMSGMMIGMTLGMLSGFLPGMYLGATNGMFAGSIFGMALGIAVGIWNGKCCGIMGVIEGIMAGFMGGLMGAMTAVMLLNDNLKAASVIMLIIGGVIALGLNYMIYKETKGFERQKKEGYLFTIMTSVILTAITAWLAVFGPRSTLFGG